MQAPLARLVHTKIHVIRHRTVDVVGDVASGLTQDGSAGDGGENDVRNGGDGHGQKCSFRNGMWRVLFIDQIRFKNNLNNKIIQIKFVIQIKIRNLNNKIILDQILFKNNF